MNDSKLPGYSVTIYQSTTMLHIPKSSNFNISLQICNEDALIRMSAETDE
jgi:hypothetical protein